MRLTLRRIPWMSLGVAAAVVLVLAAFAATIVERASVAGGGAGAAARALLRTALWATAVGTALLWKLREAADRIEDEQGPAMRRDESRPAA